MLDRTNELLALARRVDEKSFAKQIQGVFLIVSLDLDEGVRSIRTTVRVSRTGETPAPDPRGFVVIDVVRRPDSPFADRISVGRTAENDIVIPHRTVSKHHACFSCEGTDAWVLADEGSTNGTWIGGQRLAPREPRPLRGDEMVAFGECHVAVKSARALWRFLELVRRTVG